MAVGANELQLSWAELNFSHQFFRMLVQASQTLALYIKASSLCERRFLNAAHVCGCEQGVLVVSAGQQAVTNLELWNQPLFERTKTRHKQAVSHTSCSSKAKQPPSSFSLPSFFSFPPTFITFNVWHFDTEHPISRVLVGWLYMQMVL